MNKTLFLSQSSDQDPDQPQPEARMREALGLRLDGTRVAPSSGHRPLDHAPGAPRRHRFVQEGEVPVEIMSLRDHGSRASGNPSGMERRRVDDTALAAERMAREQAERAFAELTERLREVQTKLGHAELARDEAVALAAARLSQIEALRAAQPVPALAPVAALTPRKPAAPKPAPVRPRGRQKAPKPVKWWIKSTPTD